MPERPDPHAGTPLDGVDGLICDLDGVVYRGGDAVPHAVASLTASGLPVVYATNNASRRPRDVAEHLRSLGLDVEESRVVTSSTTAAAVLADRLREGARVLAVGGPGVTQALMSVGLRAVQPREMAGVGEPVQAVLQGYGSDVTASDLAEAAYAIQGGALWVATNDDATLPTERGVAPGNGSLVGAVASAVDVEARVTGKPHAPMYLIAAEVLGAAPERVLALGDRLETDVRGATAAGTRSALVLTGVHGWSDAAKAGRELRPGLVLQDLRDLGRSYPAPVLDEGAHRRGEARARVVDGEVQVEGEGADALRASLDALWSAVDDDLLSPDAAGAAMRRLVDRAR